MGESIMEATILKWHKKVGDHVKVDETVLDIATDKVDSEIPSPVEGIIAEILYPVNNVVPVGSVLAKIQTDVTIASANTKLPHPVDEVSHVAEIPFIPTPHTIIASPVVTEIATPQVTKFIQEPAIMESTQKSYEENTPFQPFTTAPKTGNNRFFSPLVLNIANSEGIALSELERIPGTGADGRVSKKDVLQYIADKRAGKVADFVPQQAPPQVVSVPPPPVQEYFHQPIVEPAPVQHIVQNKVADTPIYIAPQPIVEPIVAPAIEHEFQYPPISETSLELNTFQEPVIYPQPIQENVIHEHIAEPVFQPIVEMPQPVVETVYQPIVESQPIVEPVYQQELVVEPYQQQIIEPVQPVVQTFSEPAPQTIVAPIIQPIEPVLQQTPVVEYVAPVAPVVETPVITQPILQEYTAQQFTAVEPTPIFEPVYQPQPIVVEAAPVQPVVVAEIPEPVIVAKEEVAVAPVQETVVVAPTPTIQEPAQQKPVPVYMIPVTAPTIPLVTLAEGESGKFTTPDSAHPSGNVEIIEMDRMRKLISKHMVESKQTSAHVTSFTEADVTNMVLWRERVKVDFERREGTKLTFTPMFIDCIVKVLKRYPILNASVEGDKIIIKKDLNIGMATALPTGNLIVPVIKGADQLNIVGLSAAVNKLATNARANQLKPDDVTGGTFTFTNVGTFGTLMGTPIINQPQVAILAVGIIKKRPVVIESPNNDTIGIRHMMYLSLSYDHRVIDGSVGSTFLSDVAKEMENWDLNRTWYHYL